MARYSKKKSKRTPPYRPSALLEMEKKPRPYAKHKQWTNAQTEAAMKAVLDSTAASINSAAREHGVPITTLK